MPVMGARPQTIAGVEVGEEAAEAAVAGVVVVQAVEETEAEVGVEEPIIADEISMRKRWPELVLYRVDKHCGGESYARMSFCEGSAPRYHFPCRASN
jgi:hypothetical protein